MSCMYDLNDYSCGTSVVTEQFDNDHGHKVRLKFILKFHALLEAFQRHDIRQDFIAGNIVGLKDPELILASLDLMNEVLFPNWLTPLNRREADLDSSILHFNLLWELSPLNFQLPSHEKNLPVFNYGAWGEAIDAIFKSPYWQQKVSHV